MSKVLESLLAEENRPKLIAGVAAAGAAVVAVSVYMATTNKPRDQITPTVDNQKDVAVSSEEKCPKNNEEEEEDLIDEETATSSIISDGSVLTANLEFDAVCHEEEAMLADLKTDLQKLVEDDYNDPPSPSSGTNEPSPVAVVSGDVLAPSSPTQDEEDEHGDDGSPTSAPDTPTKPTASEPVPVMPAEEQATDPQLSDRQDSAAELQSPPVEIGTGATFSDCNSPNASNRSRSNSIEGRNYSDKLLSVSELIQRMHVCFEKERGRIRAMGKTAKSAKQRGKTHKHSARRKKFMERNSEFFEMLSSSLSLRALVSDARSRTLILTAVIRAVTSIRRQDDPAVAENFEKFSPLFCFLCAKEIINATTHIEDRVFIEYMDVVCNVNVVSADVLEEDERLRQEAIVVEALLHRAIKGCFEFVNKRAGLGLSTPGDEEDDDGFLSDDQLLAATQLIATRPSCLSQPPLPFFTGDVFYYLGSLYEQKASLFDGFSPAPSALEEGKDWIPLVPQRFKNHIEDDESIVTACYAQCLSCNDGNHRVAWHALASSLANGETVTVCKAEGISEADCYAENIRCNGGVAECSVLETWFSLAMSLYYDTRGSANQVGGSEEILVAKQSTWFDRLPNASGGGGAQDEETAFSSEDYVPLDRRDCLLLLLKIDQVSIPQAWIELGHCLKMGFVVVADEEANKYEQNGNNKIQTVEEERAEVGDMRVTKIDCYSLAISLDSANAAAWFRIALCLEDHVVCRHKMIASTSPLRIDPRVYERNVFGPDGAIRRVDALLQSLTINKKDPKVWLALGTTLADREKRVKMAQLAEDSDAATTSLASEVSVVVKKELLVVVGSHEDDEEAVNVKLGSEDCFDQCRSLHPSFAGVVDRWKQANMQ